MTKQEAIEILNWIPTKGDEVDAMEMAIEALSCEMGEWEHIWDAPDGTYKARCNQCGLTKFFIEGHDAQYEFCPSCGSKMSKAIEALKETDMGLNNGDHLHQFGEPFGWTEEEIQKHGLREILKEVDNKNDELSCSESPNRSDTIYRQDAMSIADEIRDCISVDGYWAWMERLKALPSAKQIGWVHIDDIYRLISGHSNYHGDNILAALTCLAEGKDVPNPIDVLELPERKKGEWIYGEHDIAMCDGYRCDQCGFFVPWDYNHKFIDFIKDYHWCPSCGSEMRGENDENE